MADNEEYRASHKGRLPYWGVILILIGVVALLTNLKIIPALNWDILWPVLLIVVGILSLYEHYRKGD